jgi:hypothetical protein
MLAPLSVEASHNEAKASRHIEMCEIGNGMSLLQAYLPSLEAARVWNVLEHTARVEGESGDSHSARMADALVHIIDGTTEVKPERRNAAAVVQVVVGLATLMGANNAVGEIAGMEGWLTPETVRELAETNPLRRLIVDDATGTLLELGRKRYRPTDELARHVKSRDRECRAPGCRRSALVADIDHIVPWDSGGTTDAQNLASLCRRHHLLKTFGDWGYELMPDGTARWQLPEDLVVEDPPHPAMQVWDSSPPF